MIRFHDLTVENTPLAALRPHPENPNNGDVDSVTESMIVNGVFAPITAQRSTGHILAGHTRYEALLGEGAVNAPVIWLDVDDNQALHILLADNATARRAILDIHRAAELLETIQATEGNLYGTGYDTTDLERLRTLTNDPDTLDGLIEPTGTDDGIRQRSHQITCPNCGHQFGGA